MLVIDGRVPDGAREITTGQANRVWYVDGNVPYVLKHYGDPARAANESAALTLLTQYGAPAPRPLAADPGGEPAWTAQQAVQADLVPADQFLDELADPLAAVHRIPGPHAGRLAGARRYPSWSDYLHDRLNLYASAAPELTSTASVLHRSVESLPADTAPRLLHHDLQVGHLVRAPGRVRLLLDWELAAYGDPLSDLARLAVRLHEPDPSVLLPLADHPTRTAGHRLHLYWHIHLLANAALSTDADERGYGRRHSATYLIRP